MDYGEFTKSAKRALDRGDLHTAKRIKIEGKIAAALIDALLARGLQLSVHDSEEFTVTKSTDKGEVIRALFTTDMDSIHGHTADGKAACWWSMIYGNSGWDVISDFSANDLSEEVWNELKPVLDKAEFDMA